MIGRERPWEFRSESVVLLIIDQDNDLPILRGMNNARSDTTRWTSILVLIYCRSRATSTALEVAKKHAYRDIAFSSPIPTDLVAGEF